MTLNNNLKIKLVRLIRGRSAKKMAEDMKISSARLSRIEHDTRELPAELIEKYSTTFKSVEDFYNTTIYAMKTILHREDFLRNKRFLDSIIQNAK